MSSTLIILAILFELVVFGGCANKVPDTRFYTLAPPASANRTGNVVLVLETLVTEQAYDDERIVYRSTPYRHDFYQYHRWSSSPGTLVGNYLEAAFERSGRFRTVVREVTPDAPVILGGRVVAIEEVDKSKTEWVGRIVIELTLTDTRTGTTLWQQQFEEEEPLSSQSPEGLAKALSMAMGRIASKAGPQIAELAERQAKLQDTGPTSKVGAN